MKSEIEKSLITLLKGVQHFDNEVFVEHKELFEKLASSQSPSTLFITCSDSRINPSMITQTEPGELFIVRNVGNIVPPYGEMLGGVSSAIEYAVLALKVQHVVVCGHSNCGAMNALCDLSSPKFDTMPTVRRWLRNAEAARATLGPLEAKDMGPETVRELAEQNVLLQLAHLRTHPAVVGALSRGELALQGWFYEIGTGQIVILDEQTRKTRSVDEALAELHAEA
ncbi:carbonic anhydrase [Kozakia baliensis]|uniref:Carbonic anhydrase n=1 Tax=Kozakia baliensis TaxID=153496 RepID=A0A1D8UWU2_9PROT|nr:carbonic anhydrase [Kozakia baliensis]AOX18155.1 carbonic anhydrase [Kozakia baliensis]AOX21244.1 carbonic anhydrase [Kozakia baliensis]GBR31883.1 carbonic anhydrase [Kozakia baliensis NRIC 0488]GEL64713.1 carbonic anhydrase [Kozakia baliensis]